MDDAPAILLLVNLTGDGGGRAVIHLRNVGQADYVYSSSQASCDLGIYTDFGRRLSMGVCSDAYFYERVAPGQEAAYWTWQLTECTGGGPWYGGCDRPEPVPPGRYHLRATFCEASSSTVTGPSGGTACTRTGASVEVA